MKKHILIIENNMAAHKILLETGHEISWITETEKLNNSLGYFNKLGINKNASSEEWIKWAKLLNEIKKIDLVVNFHEFRQEEAAIISKELGLDYFNCLDTINIINDKQKMRQFLSDSGMDSTPSKVVKNKDEINQFIENVKGPVVIKPLSGTGSKGVSIINNISEIDEAVEWFSKSTTDHQYYIEKFLEGPEFSVEAFSINGEHYIIGITEKFKESKHCVEVGHCFPAQLSNVDKNLIEEYVVSILTKLNVKNGPTHTEIILTNSGPVIVETHLRNGGDNIKELVKIITGLDMTRMWIEAALNNENKILIDNMKHHNKFACIFYQQNKENGIVLDIKNKNKDNNDIIWKSEILKKTGDKMPELFQRTSYVIAVSDSYASTVTEAKKYINNIEFVIG
ncbi:ATP-grasp domain-containing protein [Bacillus wiedmannii]|uniref:ATP-grasp domain-containing protein n=1 Tax=Bacillus wiedmannii TaxID=1890302 RepID=UPI000BF7131E|nr:ATP-grasp domain-containing protein [Bacillus wiedmannii]PFY98366.1 hypothetical protein COL57_10815 [Bacillus wiedmannii]